MNIPEYVRIALDKLLKDGYDAYIVGGAVRDFLMGKTPSDYDITTPSTPDETKAVFSEFPVFLQGEKHGTVGVIINGEKLEITTHRRDGEYIDHRRPESVEFSRELSCDLSRRDFTVNAFAFSQKSGLVDLFKGRDDLENKVIRAVGDPQKRFDEDALRILRALRFSSTLGFEIEENTKKAIFSKKELLLSVSGERVREEILKLVQGENAKNVVREYKDVFCVIFKELDTDVFCGNIERLNDPSSRLALFFICVRDENKYSKLKFSALETHFLKSAEEVYSSNIQNDRYAVKTYISSHGEKAVKCALKLKGCASLESLFDDIIAKGECTSKKDMKITGADLKKIGVPEGRRMGEILDALFDLVLKNEVANTTEELIKETEKMSR